MQKSVKIVGDVFVYFNIKEHQKKHTNSGFKKFKPLGNLGYLGQFLTGFTEFQFFFLKISGSIRVQFRKLCKKFTESSTKNLNLNFELCSKLINQNQELSVKLKKK